MAHARTHGAVGFLALLTLLTGRTAVEAQVPAGPKPPEPLELQIQLELPSRDQLFRPESEATSHARVREEALRQHAKLEYPPDAPLPPGAAPGCRSVPPQVATVVPDVVCYHRLYFEQIRTERYACRVPGLQPVLSAGRFYFDCLLLPARVVLHPPWTRECNTDYPKPGDPVMCRPFLFTCDRVDLP
jgi:hypothetical protein